MSLHMVTTTWIILCTFLMLVELGNSDPSAQLGDVDELGKCSSVAQSVALPVLSNYYTDVLSVMTGAVAILSYIFDSDPEARNNQINREPFASSTPTSIQSLTGNLLADMFNPISDITRVYFAYGDSYSGGNITLNRINRTLTRQRNSPICSGIEARCLPYYNPSIPKSILKSGASPKIQLKLHCDVLNPELILSARLLMQFNAGSTNAGLRDKYTGVMRGVLSVGLDLEGFSLNQCALGPAPPAGTPLQQKATGRRTLYQSPGVAGHKCPAQTECIYTGDQQHKSHHGRKHNSQYPASSTTRSGTSSAGAEAGIRVGAYHCACKQGLYLPSTLRNASISYLNGSFLERLYFSINQKRRKIASTSSKDNEQSGTKPGFLPLLEIDKNEDNENENIHTEPLEDLSAYEYLLQPSVEQLEICLPCAAVCEGTIWCSSYPPCSMVGDLAFRLPLVLLTMVTMIGAGCLLILTIKFRNDKVMRASSPGLLYVTLLGAILLYAEVTVAAINPSDVTCMLRPWIRHVGFVLAYSGLLFKTWRISVIMRVFKSRAFRTNDSELYKKVLIVIVGCTFYMTLWTIIDPATPSTPQQHGSILCKLQPWNFVAIAAEVVLLGWGAFLCYRARKAPDLYNETKQISYALWNEALWEVFIVIARLLLQKHPDDNILFIVRFLRTQFTVTAMLILVYAPKFLVMFRKMRELHGTLTDVYGARRVHRLSLMVNRRGDIRTIYCVPCGPLTYIEHQSEDSDSESDDVNSNIKEDEYSKAEVDALIEMVSKLKNEKEVYKVQVKHLVQLINTPKAKALNGTTPSNHPLLGSAVDKRNVPPKELSVPVMVDGVPVMGAGYAGAGAPDPRTNGLGLHLSEYPTPTTPGDEGGGVELARAMYKLISGNRCSRSSTVTTFVPSSPDDIASMNDLRDMLEEKGANTSDKTNNSKPLSPTCTGDDLNGHQLINHTNGIRISQSAMATLKESIQALQFNNVSSDRNSLSPHSADEYPKFVQCVPDIDITSPAVGHNNKRSSSLGESIVPSVYNGSGDHGECQGSELVDLGQGTETETGDTPNGQPFRPEEKSKKKNREKLNFIVYI